MESCLAAARQSGAEEAALMSAWGGIRGGTVAQQVFRCVWRLVLGAASGCFVEWGWGGGGRDGALFLDQSFSIKRCSTTPTSAQILPEPPTTPTPNPNPNRTAPQGPLPRGALGAGGKGDCSQGGARAGPGLGGGREPAQQHQQRAEGCAGKGGGACG